jgi:hypothetical protein
VMPAALVVCTRRRTVVQSATPTNNEAQSLLAAVRDPTDSRTAPRAARERALG